MGTRYELRSADQIVRRPSPAGRIGLKSEDENPDPGCQ